MGKAGFLPSPNSHPHLPSQLILMCLLTFIRSPASRMMQPSNVGTSSILSQSSL